MPPVLRFKVVAFVVALLAFAAPAGGCGPGGNDGGLADEAPADLARQGAETTRPNIVFVLADDLPVSILRRHPEEFPNIRALGDAGVTFSRAYVTEPVCCPSRVTALTGEYSHNHGVEQVVGSGESEFRERDGDSLAPWLDEAGYQTAYWGRYVNGYRGDRTPPGWDVWRAGTFEKLPPVEEYALQGVPGYDENGRNSAGDTHTEVWARNAAAFVERRATVPETPWMLYFAPFAPHIPPAYPEEYESLFADAKAPRNGSFDEADVSDKPQWVREKPRMGPESVAFTDELYRDMARSTKDLDDALGKILRALEESGQAENTFVVLTSDNGFHFGQHRLRPSKWSAYEEDARVPLIVRGPGVAEGATRGGFVLNNDWAPTLADLAGAPAPRSADGRSFAPLLPPEIPEGTRWRDAFLVEAIADPIAGRPPYEAVRARDRLYVRYEGNPGEEELYRLDEDPYQLENVAASSPGEVERLRSRLDRLSGCAGGSCREAEDSP